MQAREYERNSGGGGQTGDGQTGQLAQCEIRRRGPGQKLEDAGEAPQETELGREAILQSGGEKLRCQDKPEEDDHHQLAHAFFLEQAIEQRLDTGGQQQIQRHEKQDGQGTPKRDIRVEEEPGDQAAGDEDHLDCRGHAEYGFKKEQLAIGDGIDQQLSHVEERALGGENDREKLPEKEDEEEGAWQRAFNDVHGNATADQKSRAGGAQQPDAVPEQSYQPFEGETAFVGAEEEVAGSSGTGPRRSPAVARTIPLEPLQPVPRGGVLR